MFKFLKKIFRKEEEILEERIQINELDKWFNDKSKQILGKLDDEIKIIKEKVNEEIKKTKQNLEILKNAQLRNPKIPFRAKQLMEGNREAYIKKVSIFLKQIDLEKDYSDLLGFCDDFDDMLTSFGKSTIKTYHILQEFLANESSAIAGNIKNLGNLVKEIKNRIKETDISLIKNIREDIILLKNRIQQRERDKKELEESIKEKGELIKLRDDVIKDIGMLRKDKEYSRLEKLKTEKNEVIKKINEHNNKLFHSFSVIEMALKKFSRMAFENEKLIERYLKNPLFLLEDKELRIIDILKNLETSITSNQIQLKDKKKEKTIEEIKGMDEKFFNDFLEQYRKLKEELEKINNDINKINIQNKINELESSKKENELRLEEIDKNIENLKKDIDKEQIDKLKEKIEEKIKNIFNVKVFIS